MDYEKLAPRESVKRAMDALKARGVRAELVDTREKALERLLELIPASSEIMTGGSTTLEQMGFVELLKSGRHKWKNLKDEVLAEKDEAKQAELRKRSVNAEYFIGSVHAVCETGEILVASASASIASRLRTRG